MMQQYLEIKATCQDALLMFRLGDFYELFMDDAVAASQALDITLTGRDAGEAGRIAMCGVPYHAVEQYIARLVEQGYKIAVCDQVEDPKASKGLVKRDIVRIVTPGTWMNEGDAENRYLACVIGQAGRFGASAIDIGTGELWFGELDELHLVQDWLARCRPVELLTHDADAEFMEWARDHGVCVTDRTPEAMKLATGDVLLEQFPNHSLGTLGLDNAPLGAEACRWIVKYVRDTQKSALAHVQIPRRMHDTQTLQLDETASRNLELTETARSRSRKGSLLGLLDETKTAMGSRLLRQWMERPLTDLDEIHRRLQAVGELVDDLFLRESIRSFLQPVYDLERLLARLSLGSANARDLLALGRSLQVWPELRDTVRSCQTGLLRGIAESAPDCTALARRILDTIVDQPPTSVREGGMIREGVDDTLDLYRAANVDGKAWIASLEQRERTRTGVKSLKVGYNKVFGYYIEVSKANLHLVPDDYERRQTLASVERFVLPEMKERESLILQAEEHQMEREYELFYALREAVMERLADIQNISERVAVLDVLQSLAVVSVRERFVRPDVVTQRGIHIVAGRHPVVEAAHPGRFVPNDVTMHDDQHFLLITGPNMAGKSTYMRQTALIVLMAHMGTYVPATAATVGLVDKIFTRIGASDDLAAGQSTFMVEMVELAQILRESTDRSLVLLDEIGRGTSTYDGLSIAEAVMEALNQPGRTPLTLFATHYHELTQTAAALPGTANLSVLVEEDGNDIRFLHSVVARPADKSYGIQVARLAGLPTDVIERAMVLLSSREQTAYGLARQEAAITAEPPMAIVPAPVPLFTLAEQGLMERVAKLDVNELTPLEALNILAKLTRESKEALGWV